MFFTVLKLKQKYEYQCSCVHDRAELATEHVMHLRGGDAATSIVRGHACSKCGHVPCSPLATHAVAAIAEQVPFPASCINGSTSCVADLRLTLSSGGGEIYVYVPGHNHNYTAEERILLRNVSTTAELLIVSVDTHTTGGKILQLVAPAPGMPQTQRYPKSCVQCAERDKLEREVSLLLYLPYAAHTHTHTGNNLVAT